MNITTATPADAPTLVQLHHTLTTQHAFVPFDLVDADKRLNWMSYYIETQNDWQQIYLAKQGTALIGNLWAMRERTSSGQKNVHLGPLPPRIRNPSPHSCRKMGQVPELPQGMPECSGRKPAHHFLLPQTQLSF